MKTMTQAELGRIGHAILAKIVLPEQRVSSTLTIEQTIGAGILVTLLRIADDIAALRGMYNTVTMQEKP